MIDFDMHIPTHVLFGRGKVKTLSSQEIPGKKALIVISNGKSSRANGYLDTVIDQLTQANISYVVFDKIEANPTLKTINEGGHFCKDNNCDFIVALGGGSVIDASKAISAITYNSLNMWDYIQTGTGGKQTIENHPLPLIAIVTTAGTGSEIDCAGAFTNEETLEKVAFKDERLFPVITIIDPELSSSVPPKFTAYQGWDALTHSLENMINKNEHMMSTILAREAIRAGGKYLAVATNHGDIYEAREQMALCSYLSGMVIHASGTSSMHALECAMSAIYGDLPHGAGLLMLSKAYFQFFIDHHACDDIFVKMAQLLGNNHAFKPQDFIDCIEKIQKDCHVDQLKMSDYNIDPSRFEEIVQFARGAMPGNFANDRIALTDQDCLDILNKSYR